MTLKLTILAMLLTGCVSAYYPKHACVKGKMYQRVGDTSVYTETLHNCIDARDY